MARLRACEAPDVRVVLRRKDHWQPKIDDSARGQVTRAFFPGTDRDALLADDPLVLDGRAMDADVPGGGDQPPRPLRRVGVQTPTGYSFCLTTLPPQLGPLQVADLSRGRWEVERSLRLDQSVTRRDALDAERPCALKTLLHASLMASTIAAVLAHTHHLKTHPPQAGAPRTEAPLHPRLLAWQLAVSCQSMAQAFDLRGTAAKRPWDTSAAWLTHAGNDPNWRRRPSVLDQ